MVVGDVKPQPLPFVFRVFGYRVEGLDDDGVAEVFDRDTTFMILHMIKITQFSVIGCPFLGTLPIK